MRVMSAAFAAVIAFVAVAHAAMHAPAAADPVTCAVCSSPGDHAAVEPPAVPAGAPPRAVSAAPATPLSLAPIHVPSARGPPRS